jgi:septal ring factor EnvC (AmiA/AmiB activator)
MQQSQRRKKQVNRSILIVICDFLVLSVLSLSSGIGKYRSPVPVNYVGEIEVSKMIKNLKKAKLKLTATEEQLLQTSKKLADTELNLKSTSEELKETKNKHGQTAVKLQDVEKKLSDSSSQLSSTKENLNVKSTELKIEKTKFESLNKELEEAKKNLYAARYELREKASLLAASKVEISYKDKELGMVKNKLDSTHDKLEEAHSKLLKTQSSLLDSEKKLFYTQGKLDAVEKDLTDTQLRLDCTVSELAEASAKLKTTESKLGNVKGVLTSAVSELSKTKQELGSTKDNLVATKIDLTQKVGELKVAQKDLTNTKEQLKKTEKQLKTDIFKEYDSATVKLTFGIKESRWLKDYTDSASWYLPEVAIGKNNYLIADFNSLVGIKENFVRHARVYYLKYAVGPPTGKPYQKVLPGPIISLDEDRRVCMIPIPGGTIERKALTPLNFPQLIERGLKDLYLLKKDSFGKGSVNLGDRCSIHLSKKDSYLYISNPYKKGNETSAEKGDFLMTKDGRFVGLVVEIIRDSVKRSEKAKCFVFPSQIDLGKVEKIPVLKKQGQEYYHGFAAAVNLINKQVKELRGK